MKPNEYLQRVLDKQTFKNTDPEIKDLRKRRDDIGDRVKGPDTRSARRWSGALPRNRPGA